MRHERCLSQLKCAIMRVGAVGAVLLPITLVLGVLIASGGRSVPDGDALYLAVARNDWDEFEALLTNLPNLEARDHLGYTPLALAAAFGRRDAVELLLSRGAAVDAGHPQLGTPLMLALANGHHAVARTLLAHRADVHVMCDGFDPLASAVRSNDVQNLHLVLAAGAEVNAKGRPYSPLVLVAHDQGVDMLRALLAAGADPNLPGLDGTTPLMDALESDSPRCVQLLIEAGATSARLGDGRADHATP